MGETGTRFLEEGEVGGHLQERFYQYIKKFTQKDALRKMKKLMAIVKEQHKCKYQITVSIQILAKAGSGSAHTRRYIPCASKLLKINLF